jgi:hypothetical protein
VPLLSVFAQHSLVGTENDSAGNVQPVMDDPKIVNKKTY